MLETIREKTSAASTSARELAMLRRERGSNEGEIESLKSKLQMLQVRMDAQRDLLRQDEKAATDALEVQLGNALSTSENYKTELRGTKERLDRTTIELQRQTENANDLEDVRDELMAERDAQTTHLTDLSRNQEQTERTLEDAMLRLEDTEEELSSLRSMRQACDRLSSDLRRMTMLEEDEDEEEQGVGTPWSPSRHMTDSSSSNKAANEKEDARAATFSTWCRTDAVHRQLRLASLNGLVFKLSSLGSRFLASLQRRDSLRSEKEVITRTLQDEIHALRRQNVDLNEKQDATFASLGEERKKTNQLTTNERNIRTALEEIREEVVVLTAQKNTACESLEETEHALESYQAELTGTKKTLLDLERTHDDVVSAYENESLECERLKEHSADLESRVEVLGRTSDALRQDLDTAREDALQMQSEHRADRQVFNEKIQTAEEAAEKAKRTASEAERIRTMQEKELDVVEMRLKEESDGKKRYTGVSRELRDRVSELEEEGRRLMRELSSERAGRETDDDANTATISNLDRRLRVATEERTLVEASVVSMTTDIESIRRTLVRSLDDVCTKYAHQCQPVHDFVRSRSTRIASSSPGKSRTSSSSSSSLAESVRGAVREMSTLLHALASTSVAQHRIEQQELRQSHTRTTSVETELRRAQELLSDARRQHEGTLRDTQVELSTEREKARQLDHMVRQLRSDVGRTGETNSDMSKRLVQLEDDLVVHQTECASLRTRLTQSQTQNDSVHEECCALKTRLREEEERCAMMQRDLEASTTEMESLETTVSDELSSLSKQHTKEVEMCREYQDRLEQTESTLRECRHTVTQLQEEADSVRHEMARHQEEGRRRLNEQVTTAEIDISSLKQRMESITQQSETDRTRHESLIEAVRTELSTAEATVGMLREQVRNLVLFLHFFFKDNFLVHF